MSFLSDTASTQQDAGAGWLGAESGVGRRRDFAIDMHKFLKRLSMPHESGSSSFQHLNKVGLLHCQSKNRFVVLFFPPLLQLLHYSLPRIAPTQTMLDNVFSSASSLSLVFWVIVDVA